MYTHLASSVNPQFKTALFEDDWRHERFVFHEDCKTLIKQKTRSYARQSITALLRPSSYDTMPSTHKLSPMKLIRQDVMDWRVWAKAFLLFVYHFIIYNFRIWYSNPVTNATIPYQTNQYICIYTYTYFSNYSIPSNTYHKDNQPVIMEDISTSMRKLP